MTLPQSPNQPVNQSTSQPANQSTNHPTRQSPNLQSPIPNTQSPIPNLQSPIFFFLLLLLAYLISTLPLPWAVTLVAAGVAGMLAVRWPWLAWVGMAAALPFAGGMKWGPLSGLDLLLAAAVGLWFADGVRRRSVRLAPASLPLGIGVYLAALLLATLQAENLAEAAVEVIKWAEVLLVVWLVSQTLDSRQARWLAAGLLVGGSLQALLGIYQFLFRVGPEAFLLMGRFMRAAGTFHQPNPYAGYLGLTLPVAVSLALFAWQRAAALAAGLRERTEALAWAVFTTAAAGLMGLGLLASWSRGGWLGAVAGVGLVVVLRSRRALVLSLFGLLILAVLAVGGAVNPSLVPAAVTERLADVPAYLGVGVMEVVRQPVTDENFSVIERLAHWIAAVRMWEAHPWLGVGPGNYPVVYPGVRLPLWEDPLGHAHNIYLNVLAESGLTGLAAYLIMWVTVAGRLVRRLGREEDPWQRALIVGVLGVLAHLTVHNLFDNLFVQGMHLHVALWLAGTLKGED